MDLLEVITPILENANVYPLAENAVVLDIDAVSEIETAIDNKANTDHNPKLNNQQKIWWLYEHLGKSYGQYPALVDLVPGMNNLTLIFNPLVIYPSYPNSSSTRAKNSDHQSAFAFWTDVLESAWREVDTLSNKALDSFSADSGKLFELPVTYGGDAGPDIDFVAKHTGLSCEQIIAAHCAVEYIVYFIGFQPGFAYLQGMNPLLVSPRKASPQLVVTPGSVAIGGNQTGIYPLASPGGWQIIGQLAETKNSESIAVRHQLFDIKQQQPSLLKSGDRIRFVRSDDLSTQQ